MKPLLFISPGCARLIRELRKLPKLKVDRDDSEPECDLEADTWRYFIMGKRRKP